MNRENISTLFRSFFHKHLAPLGFVLRMPELAERSFAGFRQGITWVFDDRDADIATFGCHGFWSFTHEFDDAAPHIGLGKYGAQVGGSCTPLTQMLGEITEGTVIESFQEVLKDDLPELNRLTSVEQFLAEIESYPRSKHALIGRDKIFAPFNRAFCLETAGRKAEAAQHYLAISRFLENDASLLAARCKEAARRRANALALDTSQSDSKERQEPVSRVSASRLDVAAQTIESELARKVLPLGIHPSSVMPHHFRRALEEKVTTSTGDFWRSIDPQEFLDELHNFQPLYMKEVESQWEESDSQPFSDLFINEIRTRQFDEFCAMYLLSISDSRRPEDDGVVFDLLCRHLEAADEETHLMYLELDGRKAIQHVRETMYAIEAHNASATV